MYSVTKSAMLALVGITCFCAEPAQKLRICADPDNLPYSNRQEQGFENQIVRMIAQDFGMQPEYTWFTQGGKFFQKTLEAGVCDLVMGVPAGMKDIGMTEPYYSSGYVFVTQARRALHIRSVADPRLSSLRIGIQTLGDTGPFRAARTAAGGARPGQKSGWL